MIVQGRGHTMSDQSLGILIWLPALTGGLAGTLVNVVYQYFREVRSRPILKIESTKAPRRIGGADNPNQNEVYMKFRVQNTRRGTVARNCRAYLVGIHEVRGTQVMPEDLTPDSVQLPWEGGSFDPRDIPAGHPQYGTHSQYGDIVHFSNREGEAGWWFHTGPNYIRHKDNLGKFQFTILVAGDAVTPVVGLYRRRLQG